MRLHRLTFAAIGPFAGEHTIDFSALADSGVFLLEGPTGAGKSTIIDAIVFALYGQVAGTSSSSKDRLHSQHADPTTVPFVDLVFETGSGVFRVRRSPDYARPKRRGTGTTHEKSKILVRRLASSEPIDLELGEVLSERIDEASVELQRVIGLSREQFLQTIVLPQGQFAEFLRATPEERRSLLQSLFGTGVFQRMMEELAVLRSEADTRVREAEAEIRVVLTRLSTAAELDQAIERDPDETAEELLARSAVLVDRSTAEARAAACTRVEALAARDTLRERHDRERERARLLGVRTELARRSAVLAAGAARVTRERENAAEARRALAVEAFLGAAERAKDRENKTALAETAALATLDETTVTLGGAERAAVLEAFVEGATAEIGRLEPLLVLEAGIPRIEAARDAVFERLSDIVRSLSALDEEVTAFPSRREAVVALRSAAEAEADALGDARAELDARIREERAAGDAERTGSELATAKETAVTAVTAANAANERETILRRTRLDAIAVELALGLVAGSACPVCGSTTHPNPAIADNEVPSEDDIEAAERERVLAMEAVGRARSEVAVLEERIVSFAAEACGFGSRTARERRERAERSLEAVMAAVARRDDAERELVALDEKARSIALEREELREERGRLLLEAESHDVTIARSLAELREAVERSPSGEAESIVVLLRDAQERRRRLVAANLAVRASLDAERESLTRGDELATALREHGFDSPAAARRAMRSSRELAELERAVDEADRERAVVEAGLSDDAFASLPVHAVADPIASAELLVAGEARLDEATRAAERAQRTAEGSATALVAVRLAVAASAEALDEARPVMRMADLAAGGGRENERRLTLASYVLLRRFEDVVAAANARLRVMSSGRFELRRSEEREQVGARRLGLALVIDDTVTGRSRDPRSISGGETFYVSLCLALGLADIVTAEAGGIDLGTLFVDEGFGSLDPETLDSVMNELGRLSSNGRAIGVVSHVEELKQRISDRIEVRHSPAGGSILRVTVG